MVVAFVVIIVIVIVIIVETIRKERKWTDDLMWKEEECKVATLECVAYFDGIRN